MKICMVTMHGCIRVFKYTYALKEKTDCEVYLMADRDSMGWNIYDGYTKYTDKEMFQKQIRMYDRFIDIFHIHNEPDHLVEWVREISDKPIIYDCHDLQSMRTGEEPDINELAAFELSDYVIHVSEPIAKQAVATHGEHRHSIIKSWVNERFFAKEPVAPCWDSVCYEGGVSDGERVDNGAISYRYQVPFIVYFKQQGYHVTIYTANKGYFPNHMSAGAVVHSNLPYYELLKSLQLHALGIVGATIQLPIMMNAVPNKLFEYMSQGVIPVCHWADEAYNQVKDYNCGIKLSNIENARKEIGSVRKLRKNLLEVRWDFVFEKQIPQIMEIYETVLS